MKLLLSGRENQLLVGTLVVLVVFSLLQLFFKQRRRRSSSDVFPRGPLAWPILGHLPLLRTGCPHHTLAALSRAHGYGPIIGLRLGSRPAVVVSSVALAKDILLTYDKDFASRPSYQFTDSLFYGYDTAVIHSSYGPHWAMLRKIYTLELFTAKRFQDLQGIRQEEVARLLRSLHQASGDGTLVVDVGKFVADMSSDTISRLLQSKIVSNAVPQGAAFGSDSLKGLVKELEHEAAPTLGDFIPWLKCVDVLQTRSMKRLHNRFDKLIDSIILGRREAMRSTPPDELPHDFLQVLLSKESTSYSDKDFQKEKISTQEIKGIILDILEAGIHTTSITLEWAMAELLRNPRCLRKVREEIDAAIGSGNGDQQQLVSDEDIHKLPYLEKVVKEVFRLRPAAPLLLPRIARKACKVDKYMVPEGTHMFVNVWAIGRDPELWEDPESFWPERFESKENMDVRGQDYELLPFGSGRRMCPAVRLGLSVVQVTLANLVKAFEWELPPGQTPAAVDMSEKRGITSCKALPVLAIPRPRLFPSTTKSGP